jgi:hypothetical protein
MVRPPKEKAPSAAEAAAEKAATDGAEETAWEALSEAERYRMIAEAAYFRAEKRGFVGGSEIQDWVEAAEEIRKRFSGRPAHSGPPARRP